MSELSANGGPPVPPQDHGPAARGTRAPARVALCLNSSFLGFFAHAGFLDGLTQLGIRPAAVSGASAGALVAGAYAAGLSPRDMIHWFLTGELRSAFWEWGAIWRMVGTILDLPGHTGALRGHRALALLRTRLGDRRIEDCTPHLALSATDLLKPQAALLTAGPLAEAILASGAFPGMFAAQRFNGSRYWDGGLANPLPFDHWLTDPAIDVILLHTVRNPESDVTPEARARMGIRDAAGVAHEAICGELFRLKTDLARRAGKRLLLLETLAPRPRPWNTRTVGPRCVEAGAATIAMHQATLRELCSTVEGHAPSGP